MKIALKEKLLRSIGKIDNEKLLEELLNFLELELEEPKEVYNFSEEEKFKIYKSLEQLDKGQVLSEEKANKEIDQWLKE
jgi:predicted hydrocarbon binding protein